MQITRSILINAPLEKVWHVLAHNFDQVDQWSSGVSLSGIAEADSSARDSASVEDAGMAGRMCLTAFGKCYEIFEAYDEQEHTFTYRAQFDKPIPGVKSARNTWRVEAVSPSQSRFTMTGQTELNLFPGLLMGILFRFQVPKVLKENLEEAKHYIETGKPHPRKIKAMQKAGNSVSSLTAV
ncbi:MAG: SRPBCC family protein [Chloroflexota bacterium]